MTTTHGLRVTPKQTVRRPGPPQGFRLWPSVTAGRPCPHWPWVVPPQSLVPDGWGPGHFIPWAAPPWWRPHTLPTLGAIVLAGWSHPPGSFSPPGPASVLCSHPCVPTLTPSLRVLPQRSPLLLAARTEGRLASVSAAVSLSDFPLPRGGSSSLPRAGSEPSDSSTAGSQPDPALQDAWLVVAQANWSVERLRAPSREERDVGLRGACPEDEDQASGQATLEPSVYRGGTLRHPPPPPMCPTAQGSFPPSLSVCQPGTE